MIDRSQEPPQIPEAKPITDLAWRQECLNIALALHKVDADEVGQIALDLGEFVLEAEGDPARSARLSVAVAMVRRFPNMAPENFVTRIMALAIGVVEDAK